MKEIFKQVAENNGVSSEEVENEITHAMDYGINHDDPQVRDFWKRLTEEGGQPSASKLVELLVAMLIQG